MKLGAGFACCVEKRGLNGLKLSGCDSRPVIRRDICAGVRNSAFGKLVAASANVRCEEGNVIDRVRKGVPILADPARRGVSYSVHPLISAKQSPEQGIIIVVL